MNGCLTSYYILDVSLFSQSFPSHYANLLQFTKTFTHHPSQKTMVQRFFTSVSLNSSFQIILAFKYGIKALVHRSLSPIRSFQKLNDDNVDSIKNQFSPKFKFQYALWLHDLKMVIASVLILCTTNNKANDSRLTVNYHVTLKPACLLCPQVLG